MFQMQLDSGILEDKQIVRQEHIIGPLLNDLILTYKCCMLVFIMEEL